MSTDTATSATCDVPECTRPKVKYRKLCSGHDDALAEGCGGAPAPYYMTAPTPLIRNDDEHGLVVETIDGHARRLLIVESSLTDAAVREALKRLGWIAPGDAECERREACTGHIAGHDEQERL